tara:strand:- start:1692 stop:1877 length:186 start_codon:yes stop_codon:yes gene_type:complete
MVVLYNSSNKIKILKYNEYFNKDEFWKQYIEFKFNTTMNETDEVNKMKSQINKLITTEFKK